MGCFFSSLFLYLIFGLLFMAIGGAIVALVGAFAGWVPVKQIGGAMAGLGAIGFFALLASPFGEAFVSFLNSSIGSGENGGGK